MRRVLHVSGKSKEGETGLMETVKETQASPEDGIVKLADIDPMECDVEPVPKMAKGKQSIFPSTRVDTTVQIDIYSEPSGEEHGDPHQRRYMRDMSSRGHYKYRVSVYDLTQM